MLSPSDFGFNGGRPSHPELLDWLATEFMAGGWRLKRIQRLMMLSSVYRQSDKVDCAPRRPMAPTGCSGIFVRGAWKLNRFAMECWPLAGAQSCARRPWL